MNSLTVKILTGLLSVLIITTIGSQIYSALTERHDTEEAVLVTINEDIAFKGVVIRDEKVVTYDGGGVLDYTYSDGSKISVGNTIASVYSSEDAVTAKNKIKILESEIAALERAQNPGTTNYVQPETLKSKIDKEYKELLSYSSQDNFSEFAKTREDMSLVMNIYNIVTKTEQSYDERISQLQAKVKELEEQTSGSGKRLLLTKQAILFPMQTAMRASLLWRTLPSSLTRISKRSSTSLVRTHRTPLAKCFPTIHAG